eukprot:GHVL01042358.1.p1 GENE.GHVL01042358.1~~GHVL01042358.1.p1  ORF type:complete len:507 (+),score=90.63 GHVL01042358.1:117-1637(+)
MNILTFNVNGLPSIIRRRNHKSLQEFLDTLREEFNCDIICLQEIKMVVAELDPQYCNPPGWIAFYSLSIIKQTTSGYSGVGTFCYSKVSTPSDARLGLEWGSNDDDNIEDITRLDNEGRCVYTDHGHFVLFNLYVPATRSAGKFSDEIDEGRYEDKLCFCRSVEGAVRKLKKEGRHIIVVGDINICLRPEDSCHSSKTVSSASQWLIRFLNECSLVDVFLHFHPNALEAFTAWSQLTGGRITNFGCRIDYIFISTSLTSNADECKIHSNFTGSDHCPVTAKLNFTRNDKVFETANHDLNSSTIQPIPHVAAIFLPQNRKKDLYSFFKLQNKDLKSKLCEESEITKKEEIDIIIIEDKGEDKGRKKRKLEKTLITSFLCTKHTTPIINKQIIKIDSCISNNNYQLDKSEKKMENFADRAYTLQQKKNERIKLVNIKAMGYLSKKEMDMYMEHIGVVPLCNHGEPCIRRIVQKPANKGRAFYVCPRPNGDPSNKESRCNFFLWEKPNK